MAIVGILGGLGFPVAGCGGTSSSVRESPSVVAVTPGEIVLREMRVDAAHNLGCQTPDVGMQVESWAGSQGNVVAVGCGYRITYYVACETSAFCKYSVTD